MKEPIDPFDSEQYVIRQAFLGVRIVYKERCNGRWRKLELPVEDWGRGRLKYTRFSEENWRLRTPEWAWHRKDEIEYRIMTDRICDCD